MPEPHEHPKARRYRAARAWANLDQDELAVELEVDRQTVIRRENGKQLPKTSELIAVGAICHVPQEFMLHGFADEVLGTEETRTIGDRLDAIGALLSEAFSAAPRRGDPPGGSDLPPTSLGGPEPPSDQEGPRRRAE